MSGQRRTAGYSPRVAETRTKEMNLRKKAARQGYRLRSSRRRDPNALDYGVWRLETRNGRPVVKGSLEHLESWLRTPRAERRH